MTDTSAPTTAATERHMDGWTIAGLGFVVLAALAAAGYGQFNTGTVAGYPAFLAWVLPLSTDAAGLVTARVWMLAPRKSGVRDYAAGLTIVTVGLSAFSSVLHLLLPSGETVPQLQAGGCVKDWVLTPAGDCVAAMSPATHTLLIVVKILTGAIPSVMVGLMIHLLALWVTAPARSARKARPAKAKTTATSAAPASASKTDPTPATARHAAPETVEQPPAEQGGTVTEITRPKWNAEQWAIAVNAVRDGNTTVRAVVAALQAENQGMKRATVGRLIEAATQHIAATNGDTDSATTQNTEHTTDETAPAVGQE